MGVTRWGQNTRIDCWPCPCTQIILGRDTILSIKTEQESSYRNFGQPEPNEEKTPQDLQTSLPQPEPETQAQPEAARSPIATRSRTGTAIKPPLRYGREDVMELDVT